MSTEIVSQTAPIRSFCNRATSYLKTNGILISAHLNLAYTTTLFAQKSFPAIPETFAYHTHAIQKLAGLFFLTGLQKEWVKSLRDTSEFYQRNNPLGVVVSANKVVYQSINICLVVGGTIAAIASAYQRPQWSTHFYKFMFPFAITAQLLSCIHLISNIAIYKAKEIKSPYLRGDSDLWQAAEMDAYDQENIQNQNRPFEARMNQRERNFICSTVNLTLFTLYQISQSLENFNPHSQAAAGISWGFSVINVASLHFRKNGMISNDKTRPKVNAHLIHNDDHRSSEITG